MNYGVGKPVFAMFNQAARKRGVSVASSSAAPALPGPSALPRPTLVSHAPPAPFNTTSSLPGGNYGRVGLLELDTDDDIEDDAMYDDDDASDVQHGSLFKDGPIFKYIKSQADQVKVEVANNGGKPFVYQQGSIWIEPKRTSFYAKNVLPAMFYLPRIALWAPHLITGLETLRCVHCNSAQLRSHGQNETFRRVVGISRCYFIIQYRLICNGCGKTFSTGNSEFVKSLPVYVRDLFPCFLTKRSGLDKEVVALMLTAFDESFGPSPLADFIRERHNETYCETKLLYYAQFDAVNGLLRDAQGNRVYPDRFSEFGDKSGYAGYCPSGAYLQTVYIRYYEIVKPILDLEMMKRDGTVLSGDTSYKVIHL
jgi:hypothetical protein